MQTKTSNKRFEPYGSVYEQPINLKETGMISRDFTTIAKKNISQLLHFDFEVYLEMQSGMAALLVGYSADASKLEAFAVHRLVRLKPGVYFSLVAVTAEISYKLITDSDYSYSTVTLTPPYVFDRVLPRIHINEILGYYYSIRNGLYSFKGERHNYYELTFVDRGCLHTEIEGVPYILREKELLLYCPGQFHTQSIPENESCSYVTIIFDMVNIAPDSDDIQNDMLSGKVFGYNKIIDNLIQSFIHESTTQIPYMNSLMLCILNEIIVRLIQSEFIGVKNAKQISGAKHHYQDELLARILEYIQETICEPLTIAEVCEKFSLSRSSLQILFKENLNQTPKKYISELKLEKSREMIRENCFTISEIALLLGFNSIHYFSRAFTQKYGMAPSEYSKQLFAPNK